MVSLLLAIIYIAFISLGLPDSLLGSAWPIMQGQLDVPLSYAGIITMIIAGGTIVSSLCADRVIRKLGTGLVTAISVALTAAGLMGFSLSTEFWMLCLLAIPYGLGAGAIDAALNNYVALHYSSRHMSWLHAFWGVGVTISPYIMSFCLTRNFGWEMGYRSVSLIQIVLTAVLFTTLPLWKKAAKVHTQEEEVIPKVLSVPQALKLKGASNVLIAFFCYCALESTAGLWASSYLVGHRGVDAETAARFAALFYIGITVGRVLNGFIADKLGDRAMIRTGILVMAAGVLLVALPLPTTLPCLIGLVVIGLGCAPVYPCIIHSTPVNFGKEHSQSLVGIQMASAYTGSTLMPPLFGLIAQYVHIGLYPLYLGIFTLVMLWMTEALNRKISIK
ncbi:MAG: MFS transporter [Oscillospiraceae bacterium]|nr:MFS transporter [Oscillospiraceae bacterium]